MGDIDYASFRNEFVRFMAASDNDALGERLYNLIESGCSAFAHNYVEERGLKAYLVRRALSHHQQVSNIDRVEHFDMVLNLANIVEIVAFASTASANPFAPLGSANISSEEPTFQIERS